jgi:hypothetical protein
MKSFIKKAVSAVSNVVNIHNQNFASVLLANNNPNYMFVREAVMNMIEAMGWYLQHGSTAFKNPIKMFIRALPIKNFTYIMDLLEDGVDGPIVINRKDKPKDFTAPKLSFLNLKGLNPDQLEVATSMTGSVDKEQDLDSNFGIGIVSSVTTFSDLMMISRKDGNTHATIVGFRNEKLLRILPVTDVSVWANFYAKERGYDKYGNADFTEVILLGKEGDISQNTFECPYAPGVKIGKPNWLLATVYTRFANINKNIELIFEGYKVNERSKTCRVHTLNSGENNYTFRTWNNISKLALSRKFENFEKETVTLEDGLEIDYIYDGPTENEKGEGRPTTVNHFKTGFDSVFSAIEFQGEYFDIYSGLDRKEYGHFSGPNKTPISRLGVIEGSQYFRVIVRLPKQGKKMNFSRTSIVLKGDTYQDPIKLLDYVSEIYHNRPDWFIAKIEEHNTDVEATDFDQTVRDMLKDFFEGDSDVNLQNKVKGNHNKNGSNTGLIITDPDEEPVTPPEPNPEPNPEPKDNSTTFEPDIKDRKTFRVGINIPKVVFVNNNKTLGTDIAEYRESESENDEIIVNENHKIVDRFASKYTDPTDSSYPMVRIKARDLIGTYLSYSCAIGLVHKNKARGTFSYSDFQSWVSNPSLNLKAKEGFFSSASKLKTYANGLKTKVPTKPGDPMFVESLKVPLNQREFDKSKGLPVTTNIQGEEVVI